MSKETRIGLLVGLLFIIMFGLVLTNMFANSGAPPISQTPQASVNTLAAEGDRDFGYIPPTPTMDTDRRVAAAPPAAATRPADAIAPTAASGDGGGGVVRVALAPPDDSPVIGDLSGTAPTVPADPLRAEGAATRPPDDRVATVTGPETTTGGDVRTREFLGDLPRGMVHTPEEAAGARDRHVLGNPVDAVSDGAAPADTTLYEVKPGDNLYKIARTVWGPAFAGRNNLIFEANKDKIRDRNNLKVGMKIVIPPSPAGPAATPRNTTPTSAPAPVERGRYDVPPTDIVRGPLPPLQAEATKTYTIKNGDTIRSLARTYGTSVDKILVLNKGVNPNRLRIGQTLNLPE